MAVSEESTNFKAVKHFFENIGGPKQPQQKSHLPGEYQKRKCYSKQRDGPLFKEPARLIFTDEETEKLQYDTKTIQLLTEIKEPLNVVAITGMYRTGKSYLLNRLVGKKGGFKTGHKIHACTKGIWVWCRHHPTQKDQVLVLLDVEGFGDLDKVNRKEDAWLFTLATILSSTLIYNNKGTLDSYALDRLNFLEQIDSTIQVSQNGEDEKLLDFDFFFPSFVVILRDFSLEMVDKLDHPITPSEYLEELLVQKKGTGEDVEKYNRVRLLIRRYFKKRTCFAFITPCGPKQKLEKLSDGDIEPEFLQTVEDFSNYVFESKPLQLKSGRTINGRMFTNLTMHYVDAMGQNKQPSILEATKHMVSTENEATVTIASNIYVTEMNQCMEEMDDSLPTDDDLVDFHELCLSKALGVFKKLIVFDDEEIFHRETKIACKNLLSQIRHECDANSTKTCQEAIGKLNKRVDRKLKGKKYCCKSGYDDYIKDINWIVRKYTSMAGLGTQSRTVLQDYLDGKEDEEEQVYQLAISAQKGKTDPGKSAPVTQRKPLKYDEYSKSFSRPESFRHSLNMKVNKIESDMTEVLEKQHAEEKKTIQKKYVENLKLKLDELQRQRSEQLQCTHALNDIEEQLAYLNKVYEYAKNVNESMEDTTPDKDETEEPSAQRDGIGHRPVPMGASQENFNTETEKPSSKGKRLWCKVQ